MSTAEAMLDMARKSIGLSGRPNYITREYSSRNGNEYLSAAWCDMGVTYWARHSDNFQAVNFGNDYAYTVSHAEKFRSLGKWYTGTEDNVNKAKPGDIIFFDWGGTNSIGAIDHVGVVEKALGGGLVQTIEANTGDACKRKVRSYEDIAGYGRPDYTPPKPDYWAVTYKGKRYTVPWATPYLENGSSGQRVRWLQDSLNALGTVGTLTEDGEFGDMTEKAVKKFQGKYKDEEGHALEVDGVYGHHTARALFIALGGKKEDAL